MEKRAAHRRFQSRDKKTDGNLDYYTGKMRKEAFQRSQNDKYQRQKAREETGSDGRVSRSGGGGNRGGGGSGGAGLATMLFMMVVLYSLAKAMW